jgi:hypothetical protein
MWGSNYRKESAEKENMKSSAICKGVQVHNVQQEIQDQALHL